jgi:hypothetical protein
MLNKAASHRPWDDLVPPDSGYRSKLVDENQRWAFYWGRKRDFGPALLLRVDHAFDAKNRDLRGISVEALRDGNGSVLTITLNDESDGEVFEYFCRRLILICGRCSTEAEAVSQMLLEIERWHEFLGRMRNGLSLEQRLGLFGELSCFDEVLGMFGAEVALTSWTGPAGSPQDFAFPNGFVEVKTVRESGARVRISSEFQLDVPPGKGLFLRVFQVEDSTDGRGLSELTDLIRSKLDPLQTIQFDERLEMAGLVNARQYSSDSWRICADEIYVVGSQFPAIKSSALDASISSVQYRLNLSFLSAFRRPGKEMYSLLENGTDVA